MGTSEGMVVFVFEPHTCNVAKTGKGRRGEPNPKTRLAPIALRRFVVYLGNPLCSLQMSGEGTLA